MQCYSVGHVGHVIDDYDYVANDYSNDNDDYFHDDEDYDYDKNLSTYAMLRLLTNWPFWRAAGTICRFDARHCARRHNPAPTTTAAPGSPELAIHRLREIQ